MYPNLAYKEQFYEVMSSLFYMLFVFKEKENYKESPFCVQINVIYITN